MNRKRLLTILAGATAAMALQMGPAAALDLGVGEVDTSDGLSVEVDVEVGDEDSGIKLDPKVKVGSGDDDKNLEVDGGAKVGDVEVDAGEATEPVEDAVNETTKKTRDTVDGGSDGGAGGDSGSSGDDGSSGSTSGTDGSADGSDASDDEVTTASRTRSYAVDSRTPNEAMSRLSGYEFRPSSAPAGQGYRANVSPAFDLAEFDPDAEFQEPLIAAPERDFGGSDEVPAPETAEPPRADAELATSPLDDGSGVVPAGLKLLAAALVAGTGGLWHVARREVGLR